MPPNDPHQNPPEPLTTRDVRTLLGLLTEDEVANAIGIQGATLKVWRNRGEGPAFFRFRRNLFYRTADVTQWLLENTLDPRTEEYIIPRPPRPTFTNPQFNQLPSDPPKPKHKPPANPEKIIADLDRMVDKLNASRPPDDQIDLSLADELNTEPAKSMPPPESPSGEPEADETSAG